MPGFYYLDAPLNGEIDGFTISTNPSNLDQQAEMGTASNIQILPSLYTPFFTTRMRAMMPAHGLLDFLRTRTSPSPEILNSNCNCLRTRFNISGVDVASNPVVI